jgi:hypothetical protein
VGIAAHGGVCGELADLRVHIATFCNITGTPRPRRHPSTTPTPPPICIESFRNELGSSGAMRHVYGRSIVDREHLRLSQVPHSTITPAPLELRRDMPNTSTDHTMSLLLAAVTQAARLLLQQLDPAHEQPL